MLVRILGGAVFAFVSIPGVAGAQVPGAANQTAAGLDVTERSFDDTAGKSQISFGRDPSLRSIESRFVGYVDLISGTYMLRDPLVQVHELPFDSNADGFHEMVLRVTLDPALTPYRKVDLVLVYEGQPSGFTLNVGDSETNDGEGGDAGTQSRNAELQIRNEMLSIFPSDPFSGRIQGRMFALDDCSLQVSVADMFVGWGNPCESLDFRKGPDVLFALAGQPDLEGPVNYDVYVGLNRVVHGPGERIGAGLARVMVILGKEPAVEDTSGS